MESLEARQMLDSTVVFSEIMYNPTGPDDGQGQTEWIELIETIKEGDIVTGTVTRKIKGGLLVDIGVQVFLPASQVDIRRPGDIGDYIGRAVQCEVLKIDEQRRNIVVSRRSLIEKERTYAQQKLLAELEVKQIRKGVVKNIAD